MKSEEEWAYEYMTHEERVHYREQKSKEAEEKMNQELREYENTLSRARQLKKEKEQNSYHDLRRNELGSLHASWTAARENLAICQYRSKSRDFRSDPLCAEAYAHEYNAQAKYVSFMNTKF